MDTKNSKAKDMPSPTLYAVIPAVLTPISFMFQFGYNIGTMNAASVPIKSFFNASHVERFDKGLFKTQLDLLWTIAKTGFPIGGAIGSFLVSPLISLFGPRKSLFYSHFICVTASVLIALSSVMLSHEAFIVANMMLGIFCAIGEGIGAGYINDITIPRLRATMGSTYAIALTSGLTFGNIFGLEQALGSDSGWPYLLAINAVPSIAFIAYFKWVPESPRYMYMKTRDETKVLNHLSRLYGTTTKNVQHYVEDYKAQTNMQNNTMSVWQVITNPSVRWQVLSAIVIVSSIQATGINGIMYNLNNVLKTAGVPESVAPYISIAISAIQVTSSVIAGFAAKRFGRKTLFLFGNSVLASSCVVYTLALGLQNVAGPWISYIAAIATVGFSIGLNSGSGVVGFVVAPEVLTQSSRAAGMGVAVFFFWIAFVIVSFVTPYMFAELKFAALLPYLAVAIMIMVFVYFVVPETKEVCSLEIERHYEKRNRNGCCGENKSVFETNNDYIEGSPNDALKMSQI